MSDCPLHGYAIDRERPISYDIEAADLLASLPDDIVSAPVGWEIKDIIRTENQGSMGSCRGHSLTSILEYCHYVATGELLQLSRWFAYKETQKIDGIVGDRGSTIQGGVTLAKTKGVCKEDLCPYPDRYYNHPNPRNPTMPLSTLYEDAKSYKIKKSVRFRNVGEADAFMNLGLGAIDVGCIWNDRVFGPKVVTYYTRRGGSGGHAWCIVGRGRETDETGMRSFIMLNSWGANWTNSDRGFKELMPKALSDLLETETVVGLSDMGEPVPRKMDWIKEGIASQL